ncbi:hypothetical protein HispidOSU_027636 [Sigmodon hispidus]
MSSGKRQLKLPHASKTSCTTQRPCQVSSLDGAEALSGCAKQCQTPLEAPTWDPKFRFLLQSEECFNVCQAAGKIALHTAFERRQSFQDWESEETGPGQGCSDAGFLAHVSAMFTGTVVSAEAGCYEAAD